MKKTLLATTITALVMSVLAASPLVVPSAVPLSRTITGNGAPSGPHFNLNLIGAKTTNCPQTQGSGGNVIFVPLFGTSKIKLAPGDTFAVLDNNACIDKVAEFQLPPTNTTGGEPAYTVWARVTGTPGGHGTLTTCATDIVTTEVVCSLNSVITMRTHPPKFQDVTKELTTLCFINSLGNEQCVNIFDAAFEGFYWSYDNQGQKVLQLRFYPVA